MTKEEREQKKQEKLRMEQERVAGMRAFEQDAVLAAFGPEFFPELTQGPGLTSGAVLPQDPELMKDGGRGGYHWERLLLCGIDEAGRGPLAGPVAAGAVILPADHDILYLNDSKKLSAGRREDLFDRIREEALAWNVALVWQDRIDEINILQATYEAMRQAVAGVSKMLSEKGYGASAPSVLINDAVTIPGLQIPQVPVIKGDAKCLSIAAASILAKVTRDRLMEEMDEKYPGYGFAQHKGYGTRQHMDAIRQLGPCPIHRRTFIQNIVG